MHRYPGTSVFFPTLDVEHQVKWCEQIYGIPNMTPNITFTNEYYGGKSILYFYFLFPLVLFLFFLSYLVFLDGCLYVTGGTNIMFTNGDLDPWHLLSINEDFENGEVLAATYEAGNHPISHSSSSLPLSSASPLYPHFFDCLFSLRSLWDDDPVDER